MRQSIRRARLGLPPSPLKVCLRGDLPALRDAGKIANNGGLRSGHRGQRFLRPLFIACVQNDPVAIADHEPGGHLAEAVGRAGDEDACHPRNSIPDQVRMLNGG
jgi:hypothetical protein